MESRLCSTTEEDGYTHTSAVWLGPYMVTSWIQHDRWSPILRRVNCTRRSFAPVLCGHRIYGGQCPLPNLLWELNILLDNHLFEQTNPYGTTTLYVIPRQKPSKP